jgi:crotonobetainyl-CoA:carnitine CoA-transferase CaiB-like acyl-CoA transferase
VARGLGALAGHQRQAVHEGTDVIVHGYRGNALERLGLGNELLRQHNPWVVVVCHNAYGWTGPWADRRGFDSLVQMSCGIAWRGRKVTGKQRPVPLPAQALDHATGYPSQLTASAPHQRRCVKIALK